MDKLYNSEKGDYIIELNTECISMKRIIIFALSVIQVISVSYFINKGIKIIINVTEKEI